MVPISTSLDKTAETELGAEESVPGWR